MHFNPVPVMALVEIVRGLQTTDATHDMAEAIALQLGKIADYRQKRAWIPHRPRIAVDDQRGFLRARGRAMPARRKSART